MMQLHPVHVQVESYLSHGQNGEYQEFDFQPVIHRQKNVPVLLLAGSDSKEGGRQRTEDDPVQSTNKSNRSTRGHLRRTNTGTAERCNKICKILRECAKLR